VSLRLRAALSHHALSLRATRRDAPGSIGRCSRWKACLTATPVRVGVGILRDR